MSRPARILLTLLMVLSLSVHGQSDLVTAEDGKAALLHSILQHTSWPDEAGIDRFIVGIYGKDRGLRTVLARLMSDAV